MWASGDSKGLELIGDWGAIVRGTLTIDYPKGWGTLSLGRVFAPMPTLWEPTSGQPRGNCPLADVYLDTIGFTGGNMTLDALACGLPVVTMPTDQMRGCLSWAMLQRLGITDNFMRERGIF